jgi:murein tripeptide amidase MpaA
MLEITTIGRSNGHLDMPLIKIKSGRPPPASTAGTSALPHHTFHHQEKEEKPVIFIIGRQHPGETFSSFIIHGLINFLLSQHPAVLQLRETFDFWIMPIANPDGVVLGNYRCNMQGKDINRCF